jgi:carbon storage regulator
LPLSPTTGDEQAGWSDFVLILTRRVGESIIVGDDVTVTVFEVRGDAVRIGIDAPRSVQVHRQEVYDELRRANEQAVSPSDAAIDSLREAIGSGEAQPDSEAQPDR